MNKLRSVWHTTVYKIMKAKNTFILVLFGVICGVLFSLAWLAIEDHARCVSNQASPSVVQSGKDSAIEAKLEMLARRIRNLENKK